LPHTYLDVCARAPASAEAFATALARGMTMFRDRGFYKRAQIAPADLALAGVAEFRDLNRLLDNWLWNRGQEPQYKARPRHRCRCVYY